MIKQIYSVIAISGLLLFMLSIFDSCVQEETFAKAAVETSQVTSITEATATCGGIITAVGGSDVTTRGVCWSTSPNPTIDNDTTKDALGVSAFTSSIKGLTPGTTYYVRAYAVNNGGVAYGLNVIFATRTFSITTTPIPISFITVTSAIGGGNIISDGDSSELTVKARGVCWNTFPSPTIENSKTTNGAGGGIFTSIIDSLMAFTTYYVRAYATNSNGTSYGNEVSFTTMSGIIGLTTTATSAIMAYSAISGGTISSDGGAAVTERGICWSTSQSPTTANYKTINGSGVGTYSSNITGLTLATTYYIRAYAINSLGISYGNEVSFSTLNEEVNTTDLVAYFPFNGNAKESVTSLMPTSQANVSYVNGQRGMAYQGANGAYLKYLLPSTSKLKTLKSFTVAMWFKSPLVADDPVPIIMQIGKSDDLYWGNMTLWLNRLSATADSLQMNAFFLKSGAEWSGQHVSYSNTIFKVNQWMHLVFEYNGATSKYIIFKNGVKVVTSLGVEDRKANSAGDALGNLNFVNADVLNIGSWRPKSEGTATDAWMGWFKGNIDELRIYENSLTEIEVKDLYNAEQSLIN